MADSDPRPDVPPSGRKRMSVREFRDAGYLLHVNRYLHPLGLALELGAQKEGEPLMEGVRPTFSREGVEWLRWLLSRALDVGLITPDDARGVQASLDAADVIAPGDLWFSGVWDGRDDPEGIFFAAAEDEGERRRKVARVDGEWAEREGPRRAALGYMVQHFFPEAGDESA